MSETKDKERDFNENTKAPQEDGGPLEGEARAEAEGAEPSARPPLSEDSGAEVQTELEILRGELAKAQEELAGLRRESGEMRDRYLRARADLENFRRRSSTELERAREAGIDSAVLPILTVFDDLKRALDVVDESDPGKILPGVRTVLSTLERNLEGLDITMLGEVGERFDPDVHEALTSLPTDDAAKVDTIAEVFQVGFRKGDRLIRPARVVVYQAGS